MSDERDFTEPTDSNEVYGYRNETGTVTSFPQVTNTAAYTGTTSTCGNWSGGTTWYPSATVSYWRRQLKLKLGITKALSDAEYYEQVHKLMLLLKDTNWEVISTKSTT